MVRNTEKFIHLDLYRVAVTIIGYQLSNDGSWIKELFIEKAHLFLKLLNSRWRTAEDEVRGILRLFEKYNINQDAKILEVGCGNGRIVVNLAKHGYRTVGVDISPIFIDDAKQKAREYGVSDKTKFYVGDARYLTRLLSNEKFDVILSVWTTLIGYYLDKNVDVELLRQCRLISKDSAYLFILNTVNRDRIALLTSIRCRGSFYSEAEDIALIENPQFDPVKSVITNKWIFYRREGKNLIYLDEVSFSLRVYSLHEIIEIAETAGWSYIEAFSNPITLEPFNPSLGGLNITFRAKSDK